MSIIRFFYAVFRPLLSGVLTDTFLLSLVRERQHLLVIAPPKVGSTWLSLLLEKLTGWRTSLLAPAYCQREQEIDLRCLVTKDTRQSTLFSHLHLRYSEYTEKIISKSGLKCVLMTRNIYDTVVSLVDHCDKYSLRMPIFFMTEGDWKGLSHEEKVDRIVDLAVPWYFNFYAGWFSNLERLGGLISVVSYEDLASAPASELQRLYEKFGLDQALTPHEAVLASAGQTTLRNVGITGRGAALPPSAIEKIERMASYYPSIRFTRIGIVRAVPAQP
ncbi:MAG: sulfotransferase domain-containing protein [Sulfuritalea sp.]|nr:sulfotransferase domain-containing protein [Sulfuritalea sp.]